MGTEVKRKILTTKTQRRKEGKIIPVEKRIILDLCGGTGAWCAFFEANK